jgi:NAD(P)-dependent dehydrogenase (short-subunit alcohol dehydrogenase family)
MHAQDPEDFIHDLAVNLHGPYFLMRLLIPTFRAQRSGCVLNISSRAGTVVIPYSTSYCSSKAALINLTGCLQKEFDAEGFNDVHLYSVHPGGIKSTMTLKSKPFPNASMTEDLIY